MVRKDKGMKKPNNARGVPSIYILATTYLLNLNFNRTAYTGVSNSK